VAGKTDPPARLFGDENYAATRSHQDAQISNENFRAAAQAAILINGGAATAVIAFLSKDKIDPYFLSHVPIALLGYALGVLAGACMTLFTNIALPYWGLSWREYMVDVKKEAEINRTNAIAKRWHFRAMCAFTLAIVSFAGASATLAWIFSTIPKELPLALPFQ
jgi:hypothetical protein